MREIKLEKFNSTIQIIGRNEHKNIADVYEKLCYDSIKACENCFNTLDEIIIFIIKCNSEITIQCNNNINIAKYLLSNENLMINIFDNRKLGYRN